MLPLPTGKGSSKSPIHIPHPPGAQKGTTVLCVSCKIKNRISWNPLCFIFLFLKKKFPQFFLVLHNFTLCIYFFLETPLIIFSLS